MAPNNNGNAGLPGGVSGSGPRSLRDYCGRGREWSSGRARLNRECIATGPHGFDNKTRLAMIRYLCASFTVWLLATGAASADATAMCREDDGNSEAQCVCATEALAAKVGAEDTALALRRGGHALPRRQGGRSGHGRRLGRRNRRHGGGDRVGSHCAAVADERHQRGSPRRHQDLPLIRSGRNKHEISKTYFESDTWIMAWLGPRHPSSALHTHRQSPAPERRAAAASGARTSPCGARVATL